MVFTDVEIVPHDDYSSVLLNNACRFHKVITFDKCKRLMIETGTEDELRQVSFNVRKHRGRA